MSKYEKVASDTGKIGTSMLYNKKDDYSMVLVKKLSLLNMDDVQRNVAVSEAKVLRLLHHPNIVIYYDIFLEEEVLWIEREYASNCSLSNHLEKKESELGEWSILIMFSQMVSAIKFCHRHNILHRDVRTRSIFLTQELQVKLGDIGITKIRDNRNAANYTGPDTPYYIAPEICKGDEYGSKCDIWALGCVLCEMSNLLSHFDDIVEGVFVTAETYSPEFLLLMHDLLQKDPAVRPNAEEIFNRVKTLLQKYDNLNPEVGEKVKVGLDGKASRSLLYYCDVTTMELYPIKGLHSNISVSSVSVGLGHVVVVSVEGKVYSWGNNSYGQLGHGDFESRDHPTEIILLHGKSIVSASCGDYFTLFLSENGLVFSCGQGHHGSLGHGDINDQTRPKLIDELVMCKIASLSTGSRHAVACSSEGIAYTWGGGDEGQLGHGEDMSLCTPAQVEFIDRSVFIKSICCADDGTVFLTDTGTLFACGNNYSNKLGMNRHQGLLSELHAIKGAKSPIVMGAKVPTLVKDLCKYNLYDMSFGASHFTFIDDAGKTYCNGGNKEGQLGCGNTKYQRGVILVKGLEEEHVSMIACGSQFSFAGVRSADNNVVNSIYFWGEKSHSNAEGHPCVNGPINGEGDIDYQQQSCKTGTKMESLNSVFQRIVKDEADDIRQSYLKSLFKGGTSTQILNMAPAHCKPFLLPRLLFMFQSVSNIDGFNDDNKYPVVLQDMKCFRDHVILHLETTAPVPKGGDITRKLDSACSSVMSAKEHESSYSESETSGRLEYGIPLSSEPESEGLSSDDEGGGKTAETHAKQGVVRFCNVVRENTIAQQQSDASVLNKGSETNGGGASSSISEVQNHTDQHIDEEHNHVVLTDVSSKIIDIEQGTTVDEVGNIDGVTATEVCNHRDHHDLQVKSEKLQHENHIQVENRNDQRIDEESKNKLFCGDTVDEIINDSHAVTPGKVEDTDDVDVSGMQNDNDEHAHEAECSEVGKMDHACNNVIEIEKQCHLHDDDENVNVIIEKDASSKITNVKQVVKPGNIIVVQPYSSQESTSLDIVSSKTLNSISKLGMEAATCVELTPVEVPNVVRFSPNPPKASKPEKLDEDIEESLATCNDLTEATHCISIKEVETEEYNTLVENNVLQPQDDTRDIGERAPSSVGGRLIDVKEVEELPNLTLSEETFSIANDGKNTETCKVKDTIIEESQIPNAGDSTQIIIRCEAFVEKEDTIECKGGMENENKKEKLVPAQPQMANTRNVNVDDEQPVTGIRDNGEQNMRPLKGIMKNKEEKGTTEDSLKEDIKELKEDQQKQGSLRNKQEQQIKEIEEKWCQQTAEAKRREEFLKNEITNLKANITNQDTKLQKNVTLLTSVQEQLSEIQQNQSGASTSQQQNNSAKHWRSKVCVII